MQSLLSRPGSIVQPSREAMRGRTLTSAVSRCSRVAASNDLNIIISGQQSAACCPDSNDFAPRLVATLAASLVIAASTPGLSLADDAFASSALNPAVEARVQREEQLYDDNLQTRELRDFLSLLDKGNSAKLSDLEAGRLKVCRSRPGGAHQML
jgi:hypothetical protein